MSRPTSLYDRKPARWRLMMALRAEARAAAEKAAQTAGLSSTLVGEAGARAADAVTKGRRW